MKPRPSEVITSLRAKAELARSKHHATPHNSGASSSRTSTGAAIIKVGADDRYCPAGHCFTCILLTQRQRFLQQDQHLPISILPPIACDGCSADIHDEYIAGCCKTCDMDFCDECFESGRPIEEMLQEGLETEVDLSVSMGRDGEITMSPTHEYCAAGHQLGRVCAIQRKRHLQDRDNLSAAPTIECDCCSKEITNEQIAGCCLECDIDFCENCFKSGQSFEDVLKDRIPEVDEELRPRRRELQEEERHNGQRPTYKGSGRVSYDDYPDPTSFQWTFTGSCEIGCVEFFEKDFARLGVVKLDFFYAKGKLRTVLDHPKKGKRRLFAKGKKLAPKLYRKILLDPRTHTDKRYHKRRKLLV
jgi:hypothetical protein